MKKLLTIFFVLFAINVGAGVIVNVASPADMSTYGLTAIEDNGADTFATLSTLIATVPDFSTIYFPPLNNGYLLTGSLDCGSKSISLLGANRGAASDGLHSGSILWGNVPGPLFKTIYPAKGITIDMMGFANNSPTGTAIALGGVGVNISNVNIKGYIGIAMQPNTFTANIHNAIVHWSGNTAGSIGIMAVGHISIDGCDVVGYDNGIRAYGTTVNIRGCRIEVNNVGMMLGMRQNGTNWTLSRSLISGNSLEANDIGIILNATASTTITALGVAGSSNSPSHQSIDGVWVKNATDVILSDAIINGGYSGFPLRVINGTLKWRLYQTLLGNTLDINRTTNLQEIP